MELTLTDINETRKDIIVTVSGDEVALEEKNILRQFSKSARIPGFRPGKAPEALIRQKHGKQLQDELNRAVLQKAFREALDNSGVEIYNFVDFPQPDNLKPGSEVSFTFTADIQPEIELPEYANLEVETESTAVNDEEIDQMIDNVRRQRADFKVVEQAATTENYVKLTYEGSLEGVNLEEVLSDYPNLRSWAKAEDTWEEAGSEDAKEYGIPAIIDGLIGMKAGDKKEVVQEVSADFEVEALRGKEITYSIEVKEVRERILPEIDDAFLKSLNAETLEDLKSQIMDHIEGQKKQAVEQSKRNQILDRLAETPDFPLPESALEKETQNVMARIMSQNMQNGVAEEEFEKNKEALHAQASNSATRDVKLQILLSKIAKKEEIKVEDVDLSRAVYQIAQQRRQDPKELVTELKKDRNQLSNLQRQVLFSKTLDFLSKNAKVSEKAVVAES